MENLTAQDIAALGAMAYTAASIVIRLTPTVKDDEVFKKIAPWHDKLMWAIDKVFTASRRK